MTTLRLSPGPVDSPSTTVHDGGMTLTQADLILALEKHGLPTYGTDAELQVRYDRNNLGKPPEVAKPEPAVVVEDGNKLLSNAMAKDAPMAEVEPAKPMSINEPVEVTSDNVQEPRPVLTAFGPRKPGRPPKVQ